MEGRRTDENQWKFSNSVHPFISQHSNILSHSCPGFQATLVAEPCGCHSYTGNELTSPPKGLNEVTLPSGWTFLSSRDAYWSICVLSGICFTIFWGGGVGGRGRDWEEERDKVKLAKMLIIIETRLWVHSGLLLFSIFVYVWKFP